jgi:hypothetical protein
MFSTKEKYTIEAIFPFKYRTRASRILAHTRYSKVSIRRVMGENGEEQRVVYSWGIKNKDMVNSTIALISDAIRGNGELLTSNFVLLLLDPENTYTQV